MSSNPSAPANGEAFAVVLDMGTAPIGHLKLAVQMDDTSTFILRASQYPLPSNGSGIFWAVVYENNSTLATAAGSGIFKMYLGDCRSSGVTEVATQVITTRANTNMEQFEDVDKPLTFGFRATNNASTAAFIPSGSIIDDVSIWHTALKVPQLEYLKNSGIAIVSDSAPVDGSLVPQNVDETDLVANWTFNNNDNADNIGINSAPATLGRLNFGVTAAGVTPVPGVHGGSGVKINVTSAMPSGALTLYRNSGMIDLFPHDVNGNWTWLGWVKQNGAFNSWTVGWTRTTLVNGTAPSARMGAGRNDANAAIGGGLIRFDASGQVQDVTTENMTEANNLRPPLGVWSFYAFVWDNTNRMYYVVKDAQQIIGFQHGPPSGISRARFDVDSPDTDTNFTLLPRGAGTKPDFDDWAIYNRVLTFAEMSGYALNGVTSNGGDDIFVSSQEIRLNSLGVLNLISDLSGRLIQFS